MIKLIHGECLQEMDKLIEQGIIFDAIITDPPYGTTACKWDSIIPLDEMWVRLKKLIKPNGAIVLFGSEPYSSVLRTSNLKMYKYDWIWDKKKPGAFAIAKYRPLIKTENISIFCLSKHNYYPIMEKQKKRTGKIYGKSDSAPVKYDDGKLKTYDRKYPKNVIEISNANQKGKLHPTQKPVALMEYLIKTYTNEGEIVLDFTAGSGTTGVACKNLNRDCILIEKEPKYCEIIKERCGL